MRRNQKSLRSVNTGAARRLKIAGASQAAREIICNKCGKKIRITGSQAGEDFLHVEKTWGYFSEKDGIKQSFNLCESCCDAMLGEFMFPAKSEEARELI